MMSLQWKIGFMLWKKGCLPDSHLNSKEQLWLWNEPWVHGALLWMSEWRMDLGSAVWFSAPLCHVASAGHKIHWKIPPCVLCCCKFRLCCLIQRGTVKHMLAAVKRDSVCWSSQLCHPRKHQLFMHWSTSGAGELLQLSQTGSSVQHKETLPCPGCLGYDVEIWGARQSEFQQIHDSHEPLLKL